MHSDYAVSASRIASCIDGAAEGVYDRDRQLSLVTWLGEFNICRNDAGYDIISRLVWTV